MKTQDFPTLDSATLDTVTGGATRFYESADAANAQATQLHGWNPDKYYYVERSASNGKWYVTNPEPQRRDPGTSRQPV